MGSRLAQATACLLSAALLSGCFGIVVGLTPPKKRVIADSNPTPYARSEKISVTARARVDMTPSAVVFRFESKDECLEKRRHRDLLLTEGRKKGRWWPAKHRFPSMPVSVGADVGGSLLSFLVAYAASNQESGHSREFAGMHWTVPGAIVTSLVTASAIAGAIIYSKRRSQRRVSRITKARVACKDWHPADASDLVASVRIGPAPKRKVKWRRPPDRRMRGKLVYSGRPGEWVLESSQFRKLAFGKATDLPVEISVLTYRKGQTFDTARERFRRGSTQKIQARLSKAEVERLRPQWKCEVIRRLNQRVLTQGRAPGPTPLLERLHWQQIDLFDRVDLKACPKLASQLREEVCTRGIKRVDLALRSFVTLSLGRYRHRMPRFRRKRSASVRTVRPIDALPLANLLVKRGCAGAQSRFSTILSTLTAKRPSKEVIVRVLEGAPYLSAGTRKALHSQLRLVVEENFARLLRLSLADRAKTLLNQFGPHLPGWRVGAKRRLDKLFKTLAVRKEIEARRLKSQAEEKASLKRAACFKSCRQPFICDYSPKACHRVWTPGRCRLCQRGPAQCRKRCSQ